MGSGRLGSSSAPTTGQAYLPDLFYNGSDAICLPERLGGWQVLPPGLPLMMELMIVPSDVLGTPSTAVLPHTGL